MRGLLETSFDSVVMVGDESSLFETAKRLNPLLAIVDLPLIRGDDLRSLRALCSDLRVIVMSVHDEPSVRERVMKSGADGFILKRDIAAELMPMIDRVLSGHQHV